MRAVLVAGLLGLSIAVPSGAIAEPACAGEAPHAALVIDTGPSSLALCVALDQDFVSGLHLIELASEQHGLAYAFGEGGQAVCTLAGVGPEGGDCFSDYPDFWGYWRADASGAWTWASTGAGSAVVTDGDAEGWSWGRGDTAAAHPPPPVTAFERVCVPEPAPAPSQDSSSAAPQPATEPAPNVLPGPSPPPTAGPSPSPPSTPAPRSPQAGERGPRAPRSVRRPALRIPPTEPVDQGGPAEADGGPALRRPPERPPLAGVAGLAGACALSAGAVALRRRRRR